jgi:hypothetical protein
MEGALRPDDSKALMHMTELLLDHLGHLYWELSRRDALEGQHLRLKVGERCRVEFWVDEGMQVAHIERRTGQKSEG